MHPLPSTVLAPVVVLGGDGAPRREVVGQLAPLATGTADVEDGVDEGAAANPLGGTTSLGLGQQGLDHGPLLVRQITGVSFPFVAHARIIRAWSIRKRPLSLPRVCGKPLSPYLIK